METDAQLYTIISDTYKRRENNIKIEIFGKNKCQNLV